MKRSLIILTSLLTITVHAQTTHDWENPAVLGINKLPYHATLQLPSKEKECQEIVSLDGQWLFHWSPKPEDRPVDFYKEDYDVSGWDLTKLLKLLQGFLLQQDSEEPVESEVVRLVDHTTKVTDLFAHPDIGQEAFL